MMNGSRGVDVAGPEQFAAVPGDSGGDVDRRRPSRHGDSRVVGRILISWIGLGDLRAPGDPEDCGPLARFLDSTAGSYGRIVLLNDVAEGDPARGCSSPSDYLKWLTDRLPADTVNIELRSSDRGFRNDLAGVWDFSKSICDGLLREHADAGYDLLLSPGYPTAQTAMLVASQVCFDRRSVRALQIRRPETGRPGPEIEPVELPFNLLVDVLPRVYRSWRRLESGQDDLDGAFAGIIGESDALLAAKLRSQRLASTGLTVMLRGERGTGKDLFARAIHKASGRTGRFITCNCAGFTEDLMSSTLFGHVEGAFTGAVGDQRGYFEAAAGGTLFLDEIGEISPTNQARLLRAVEQKVITRVGSTDELEVDVRLICATNRDLEAARQDGTFRDDLYDRLADDTVALPPLRERGEDIRLLVDFFLQDKCKELGKACRMTPEAVALLCQQRWSGNVRELESSVRRIVLHVGDQSDTIEIEDVSGELPDGPVSFGRPLAELASPDFFSHLVATLEELIERFGNDGLEGFPRGRKYDLLEEILWPLAYGLVFESAERNKSRAQAMLNMGENKSGIDMSKQPHDKRLERFNESVDGRPPLRSSFDAVKVKRIRYGGIR
jgi:DNA-binding NtrC family response regulator